MGPQNHLKTSVDQSTWDQDRWYQSRARTQNNQLWWLRVTWVTCVAHFFSVYSNSYKLEILGNLQYGGRIKQNMFSARVCWWERWRRVHMLPADTVFCSHVSWHDRFTQIKQNWVSEGEGVSVPDMDDRNEVIAHRRHVQTCIQIYKCVFLLLFFY